MNDTTLTRARILVGAGMLCVLLAAWPQVTAAGEIYVFGDSLSDTGNLFLLTGGTSGDVFTPDPDKSPRLPTPPYYEGARPTDPSGSSRLPPAWDWRFLSPFAGGTNYAFIGAVTGPGSSSPFPIPTVKAQVNIYVNNATAAAPDDLFVVWGGANDFLYGQTDPALPVSNLVQAIEMLHNEANATTFFVPNLPPLGRTPTGAALDPLGYDLLTTEFNALLDTELDTLRDTLGVTIHEFDVYTHFERLLADPLAYGLTNVTRTAPAVEEDPSSPLFGYPTYPYTLQFDPAESLFFDGVHPTARGHALLAEAAAESVPEPGTLVLFLAGLILWAVPLRRSLRHARG